MKLKGLRLVALVAILAMVLTSGAVFLQAQDEEVYTVGSDIAWQPFEWMDENGNPVGFDMDLVRSIAIVEGFEVKFQDMAFDALIAAVNAEKIDLIASGMTINEKREKQVDFSDPYWFSDQAILIQEDSDLNAVTALSMGHTVGAQRGTTGAAWVQDNLIDKGVDVELKLYETYPQAELDLVNKRIHAVLEDEPAAEVAAANKPLKVAGKIVTGEAFGMPVAEGDPLGLLPKINEGLKKVQAMGIYDNLKRAYFGVGTDLSRINNCYAEYKHFFAEGDPAAYATNLASCMLGT